MRKLRISCASVKLLHAASFYAANGSLWITWQTERVKIGGKMKKNLKTFISENRAAFDDANPPTGLWQRIAAELDQAEQPHRKTPTYRMQIRQVLKVAAVTLLIGTAGIFVYFYGRKQGYDEYSNVNPQLAAEQRTYARLVMQKKDSVAYIAASNPAMYGEFSKVLNQMETNY